MRLLPLLLSVFILLILIYILYVPYRENSNEKLSDYILIQIEQLSDSDFGGFYWWMHQIACAVKIANHNKKKVLVYFNKGPYWDETRTENSWWHYYFDLPVPITEEQMKLIEYALKYKQYKIITSFDLPDIGDKMHLYKVEETFTNFMREKMYDTEIVYKSFLKLNDKVIDVFNKFCNVNNINFDDQLFLGLHYRGTDKWFCYGQDEDLEKNEHLDYKYVAERVQKIIKEIEIKENKRVHIYVCSDEQPFVNYINNVFERVYTYDAFRSPINTSGVKLSENVNVSETDDTEDGRNLAFFVSTAIHRGFNNISPYKKGLDAVIDILCLSKCKYFIRCQNGNFSSQPKKWNPEIIEINLSEEIVI